VFSQVKAVEVGFEPTEGLPLHTLSRTEHGRPPLVATGLTWAEGQAVVAGERPRTGVNETKTETRACAADTVARFEWQCLVGQSRVTR
jgi:hypothetical protein